MGFTRALRFLLAAAACLTAVGATATASADPYIALGDSSAAGSSTYVALLNEQFETELGVDELFNFAQAGVFISHVTSTQLPAALNEINAADDTKAVTISIGGNEGLGGCFTPTSDCPTYRSGFRSALSQMKDALAEDPGEEVFVALAYWNPKNGLAQEVDFDHRLLGSNLTADQCVVSSTAGLNDVIFQEAGALGIPVANAYPEFKEHGQAYISGDQIHPNSAGHAAIAAAFNDPVFPADCPDPPDPTCETDQTLCPPDPTCETDQSLCPPDPTCETDQTLCPDKPDTRAPQTTFTKGPVKLGKRSVKFVFKSSEKGSKFKCSLDGKKFSACKSPKKLKGLKKGRHTFRVRATDAAGNVDRTPAKRTFRIKR